MIIGIVTGFGASLLLAISYVFSSYAVRKHRQLSPIGLLCKTHVLMGVMSLLGLPLVWSPVLLTELKSFVWPLVGCVLFYLGGQISLFIAQRQVDSSQVVPMLGLKLIVLAAINLLILKHAAYGWTQWLGIFLTLGSTAILHQAGRKMPLASFMWVIFTCIGYASSDVCVTELVLRLQKIGITSLARSSLAGAFMSYTCCGLLSLAILPFLPRQPWSTWRSVAPFSFFWLMAMLLLFACFASIGAVNGNIIQSSRGLMAILLGAMLAKAGFTELEEKVSQKIFARRVVATLMMIAAIVSYNWKNF